MTELKKCPFCGGEAETMEYGGGDCILHTVRCSYCAVETALWDTEKEAIETWNRRVEDVSRGNDGKA